MYAHLIDQFIYLATMTHVINQPRSLSLVFSPSEISPLSTWGLPEFFYWGLLFLRRCKMPRVINGEKHNVPVCWKPSHEKRVVKVLVRDFDNLRRSNPRGRDWQNDQKSPNDLEKCGGTGVAPALRSALLAGAVDMGLGAVFSWKQSKWFGWPGSRAHSGISIESSWAA